MTQINLAKDFIHNRVSEEGENCDGDKAILSAIRRHRHVYQNYIFNRLKSVVEMKLINFFWANTWEQGRVWTSNEITKSFLSRKLSCDGKEIIKYLKRLQETGFLKRTPYGNKSYKYSLDFECDWVKFVVTLEEECPFSSDLEGGDDSSLNKIFRGEIPPKDPDVWGGNTPQKTDPIYNASYTRFLKETIKEKSPLFEKWKKQGNEHEKVISYVKSFIKRYELDWGCASFMSKQDDMINVYESLRIANLRLSNGFRPKKNVSAYVSTLIKKNAGREALNKSVNVSLIKRFETEYKLKVDWTKAYVWVYKGNDKIDIYFGWEPKAVEDILNNVVNFIDSLGSRSDNDY